MFIAGIGYITGHKFAKEIILDFRPPCHIIRTIDKAIASDLASEEHASNSKVFH